MAAREMFAKMAGSLDSNRKIRKGGADAREVYLWALRQVALRDSDGSIPAADVRDYDHLADQLMRPADQCRHGVERALAVELIAIDGDRCVIVGWDEEWGRRAKTGQERTAKYRERLDQAGLRDGVTVTRDAANVTVTMPVTCDAGEERRGEEIKERDRVTDAAQPFGELLRLETPQRAAKPARARQVKHSLPDGWVPNLELQAEAHSLGLDPLDQASRMRNWSKAEGARKCDWDATFRNWIRRAADDPRSRAGPSPASRPSPPRLQRFPSDPP